LSLFISIKNGTNKQTGKEKDDQNIVVPHVCGKISTSEVNKEISNK
jgi:hypothetical protein